MLDGWKPASSGPLIVFVAVLITETVCLQRLSDEHDDEADEPMRADFEWRKPRCRICREESVSILANVRLDWRGVPIILGCGKTHRITLTEILRDLAPLNEGHAKRHYGLAGMASSWGPRMFKEFKKALRG